MIFAACGVTCPRAEGRSTQHYWALKGRCKKGADGVEFYTDDADNKEKFKEALRKVAKDAGLTPFAVVLKPASALAEEDTPLKTETMLPAAGFEAVAIITNTASRGRELLNRPYLVRKSEFDEALILKKPESLLSSISL